MAWQPKTVVIAAALLLGNPGCSERNGAPELLDFHSAGPAVLELGAPFELRGTNLPAVAAQGVEVEFRGEIRVPGQAPRQVSIQARAERVATDRVVLRVDDDLVEAFCGSGALADHVAFEGDAIVLMHQGERGARVQGTLPGLQLDIIPLSSRRLVQVQREAESRELLAMMGMQGRFLEPRGSGMQVEQVSGGSAAERGGIAVGDTVVSVDGVRLLAASDFRAAGSTAELILGVHSQNRATRFVRLHLGSAPLRWAAEWTFPVLLLGFLTALLATQQGTLRETLRTLRRHRASHVTSAGASASSSVVAAPGMLAKGALVGLAVAVPQAATQMGWTPDGIVWMLTTVLWALLVGLVLGGFALGANRSLKVVAAWRRLKPALIGGIAMLLAMGLTVASSGAVRLGELGETQLARGTAWWESGAWPWTWRALQSPFGVLGGTLWLVAAALLLRPIVQAQKGRALRLLFEVALAVVGAQLWLGGWHLPGVHQEELAASPLLLVLAGMGWLLRVAVGITLQRVAGQALESWRPMGLRARDVLVGALLMMVAWLGMWFWSTWQLPYVLRLLMGQLTAVSVIALAFWGCVDALGPAGVETLLLRAQGTGHKVRLWQQLHESWRRYTRGRYALAQHGHGQHAHGQNGQALDGASPGHWGAASRTRVAGLNTFV